MRINRWSDTGGMILIVQHSLLQTLLAEMSAPSFWRTMMTLTVEKHARISTEYSHDCELVTKKYRSGTKSIEYQEYGDDRFQCSIKLLITPL
jgi:hypothetical protein